MAGKRRDIRSIDSQHDRFDGTSFRHSLFDTPASDTPNNLEAIQTSRFIPVPIAHCTARRANAFREDWGIVGTSGTYQTFGMGEKINLS